MWRLAILLLFVGFPAWAQSPPIQGNLLDASLTVGTAAKTISTAATADAVLKFTPRSYLQICNDAATGGNNIGINPTATAVIASAGTHTLFPGGCQTFETDHIPSNAISVIASGSSTPVTVWYH